MSDTYIPQTSASDRYEAARKALARYDKNVQWFANLPEDEQYGKNMEHRDDNAVYDATLLASALRALITPPGVGESVEKIAKRVEWGYLSDNTQNRQALAGFPALRRLTEAAVRAGIQSAHESWECEDRPTQEQMLRWLGINYMTGPGEIVIYGQTIERED